jgi:hypothetical protein
VCRSRRAEREPTHICALGDVGEHAVGTLVVTTPRELGEALLAQHLGDRRGADLDVPPAEHVGDVVDRQVALAHLDDEAAGAGLLRLLLRPVRGVDEEDAPRVVPEVVAQHAERGRSVAEGMRNVGGRSMLDEVCAQRLVLAVASLHRLQEESCRVS